MTEVEIGLAIQEAVDELTKAINRLAATKKQVIQQLAEKFEKADYPLNMISAKITEELHDKRNLVAASLVRDCLDDKYKDKAKVHAAPEKITDDAKKEIEESLESPDNAHIVPEKELEESSKPIVIDTSGEEVDDETNEQHDPRSEQLITDEVNKSMHNQPFPHDREQEDEITDTQRYDYESQKSDNKIRFELQQQIDQLQKQLENKQADNELLKREIEESKNHKLETRIADIDELNKNLKIENEQLRHALTKHSFETAKEMEQKQGGSEDLKNLTNYVKQLEEINNERYKQIQELNQKIESFSHIDKMVDPQPLELDLSDKEGFLGLFFSYRNRKVLLLHNGQKITNIKPGGDIK